MKKFRKKPVVIEAVQIRPSTFDDPHPNPEHVHGVRYDPIKRCAMIAPRLKVNVRIPESSA